MRIKHFIESLHYTWFSGCGLKSQLVTRAVVTKGRAAGGSRLYAVLLVITM